MMYELMNEVMFQHSRRCSIVDLDILTITGERKLLSLEAAPVHPYFKNLRRSKNPRKKALPRGLEPYGTNSRSQDT